MTKKDPLLLELRDQLARERTATKKIVGDYRDTLTILSALLNGAVDEQQLPDDVRAVLPQVRQQFPKLLTDLATIEQELL